MSNWSLVFVNWKAIDVAAEGEGHKVRAQRIAELFAERHVFGESALRYQWIPGCADKGAMGGTCQCMMVMHINGFHIAIEREEWEDESRHLATLLRRMAWEFPDDVTVGFKDEQMDDWMIVYPCKVRRPDQATDRDGRMRALLEAAKRCTPDPWAANGCDPAAYLRVHAAITDLIAHGEA